MATFATLGPENSNHDLVTRRYMSYHGLPSAKVRLVESFSDALALMVGGEADFTIQVAVHPSATETVAKAWFQHRISVVDTFIAPSHPLAVLTRVEVSAPRTLALQPATRDYADLSRWTTLVPEISTASVAQGLLAGRYDSGLTRLDLAARHPGRFRVDVEIGTIDDPWIVYGKARACEGDLLAWKNGPIRRLLVASH